MSMHTSESFWEALRRIVPNIPERDVARCVITVTPCNAVRVDLTMYATGGGLMPQIDGELGYAVETRRFRIVPDEDPAA